MQITQTRCVQNPCDELKNIFEECKATLENFYEEKANSTFKGKVAWIWQNAVQNIFWVWKREIIPENT